LSENAPLQKVDAAAPDQVAHRPFHHTEGAAGGQEGAIVGLHHSFQIGGDPRVQLGIFLHTVANHRLRHGSENFRGHIYRTRDEQLLSHQKNLRQLDRLTRMCSLADAPVEVKATACAGHVARPGRLQQTILQQRNSSTH